MKTEIFVRFANEGVYYNKINVDTEKIKDPTIFTNEVFITIDNTRVAIKREDWEKIQNEKEVSN